MGLDMYLDKNLYIWKEEDKIEVKGYEKEKIKGVVFEGMYWRKSNAIHKWFVDNVQEGEDNCGKYFVDPDKLKELLEICKKVKLDHSLAPDLLPCQEGFFFGSSEYDEWYFKDLDYTIKGLKQLVKEENFDYYYHSSW
jgi:hypothetical protein